MSDRYHRQRLLPEIDQERLASSSVLLLGVGALGNEVLSHLAAAGVGHLVIVDFDRVELSNLHRMLLFRDQDVGRSKVRVAAREARRIDPGARVEAVDGDFRFALGLGFFRRADVVVGCLDSVEARAAAAQLCALAGVPYVDAGTSGLIGEVRHYLPGDGPCYACTLGPEGRKQLLTRWSCTGLALASVAEEERPALGATSGVVGSHQAMAVLLAVLDRQETWGTAHVYDGLRGRMEPVRLPRDPECPNHEGPLPIAASYQGKATQTSAADLDASLGPIAGLCLRYALVVALACANGHREEVLRPLAALASEVLPCPECGEAPREAEYGDGKGSGPDGGGGDLASVAPRRIEIESLDGRVFRTNVQGNTGVSALAGQFVRQHVHGDRTSSRRERAVVDLERDGEWRRLNGNATVHAAGVEDGDRLRIHSDAVAGAMNPLRREAALNDVQQQLEELAARDERIELRPNLPRAADRYEITLRCGGWGPPESSVDSPYRTQQQEVVLEYPADFPAAPPQVWWRSPIFHPNVRPKDGYVCLGAFQESFTPLFGPVALVLMLIELSEYRNYELDGVLNREAAMWAQLRPELIAGHGGWPFQPTLKEERDDEEPTLEFEEHGTGVGLRRRRR